MKTDADLVREAVYTGPAPAGGGSPGREWRIAARRPVEGAEVLIDAAELFPLAAGCGVREVEQAPAGRVLSVTVGAAEWYEEIGRLRAIRQVAGEERRIHARTAAPEGEAGPDLIRATWAAMAAILGGADWIEMTPAGDSAAEEAMAVRALLILREESGVRDVAGDAWLFAAVTAAWLERMAGA